MRKSHHAAGVSEAPANRMAKPRFEEEEVALCPARGAGAVRCRFKYNLFVVLRRDPHRTKDMHKAGARHWFFGTLLVTLPKTEPTCGESPWGPGSF